MTHSVVAADLVGMHPPAAQTTRRRGGMRMLIARRLLHGLLTLLLLSILVFAATQALPGDAAKQVLGPDASPVAVTALRHQLGLDQPVWSQYGHWIWGVLRGNLGTSLTAHESVSALLRPALINSATLLFFAAVLSIPLSVGIGIRSAVRRDRLFDTATSMLTLTLAAIPEFVIGLLLVVLLATGLLHIAKPVSLVDPTVPLIDQLGLLVLPVLTLVLAVVPYMSRMMRSSMIEILDSDYIESARLNGIPERRVIMGYALRNAIAPTVQVIALVLAYLAGSVVVVEAVFNYPGIGTALINAVRYRDLPVVQVLALAIGAVYVVCNLVADVIAILVTPRLRTAQ
jgi:peptide/nickel transport system permease protein